MQAVRALMLGIAAAGVMTSPAAIAAERYPSRPIHFISGFQAGGGVDTTARVIADWLSSDLGQQVVVEDRTGSGGNIAAQWVVNAPPDGYTLLWCGISNAINASFYDNLPFDFAKDIAPVSGVGIYPLVLEVHPSVQAKTLAEFVALAKANPGKINLASYGTGSVSHLGGELFKMRTGINMVHVPFSGRRANAYGSAWRTSASGHRYGGRLASAYPIGGTAPARCDHRRARGRATGCADACGNSCRL